MIKYLAGKARRVLDILKPRSKAGLFLILFLAVVCSLSYFHSAQAFEFTAQGMADAMTKLFGDACLTMARYCFQAAGFIIKFVIEIASYNGYINSRAVILGWTLVRDVANMMFVIILLVIAFGTVLGVEKYEWKSLLVKFVMAAVLVNFSRIICGVIIDAAQVFLMTFLNGVAAVAAGNLVTAFHLEKAYNYSQSVLPENAANIMENMVVSVAVFLFAAIAALVIGAYLVVLLFRMVSLWVLIILSPLAFILSVLPQTQNRAGEWWKEFTNNVISGPILAFFLWLSFAVAGGGNAQSDTFTSQNTQYLLNTDAAGNIVTENVIGNVGEMFEWTNVASFCIAIAMLLVGVKKTQELGVAGAGMLGAAVDLGKKAVSYATGFTAARWAVGQGIQLGKKGVTKVAQAPFKFVGKAVGKRAESAGLYLRSKGYQAGEWWNRQVVEKGINRMGKKPGEGAVGFFGRRLQFGSTEAKIETRKKILEEQEKLYKTSIIEPESLKMSEATLKSKAELGAKIKEGVVAGRMEKARKAVDEKVYSPSYEKDKKTDEIVRDEKGEPKLLKLADVAAAQKAKAARIEFDHKRHDGLVNAKARDDQRAEKGLSRVHEDVERAAHVEEDAKFYAAIPLEKVVANIKNQRAAYNAETDTEKKKAILKDMHDQMFAAMGRGASFGADALAAAYGGQNGDTFSAANPEDQQAVLLSALLQEKVGRGEDEIAKAAEKLAGIYEDSWGAVSAHLASALKKTAETGGVGLNGLMKLTDDGQAYRFTKPKSNDEDAEFHRGEEAYAVSEAKGRPKNISYAVDRKIVDGKIQLSLKSDKSVDNLATLLPSSKISMSNFPQWILRKVESALTNSDPKKVQEFINKMRKKHTDDKAIREMFSRFTDETKRTLQRIVPELTVEGAPKKGRRPGEPLPRYSIFNEEPPSETEEEEEEFGEGEGI